MNSYFPESATDQTVRCPNRPTRQPARRFGALVCPLDVIEDGLRGGGLPEWILI